MNLGIYCETLDCKDLTDPGIIHLLGSYGVTLAHAIRFPEKDGRFNPDLVAQDLELGSKLREAGAKLCFWPLLPKSIGYWINERNLDAADMMTDAILEGCRRFGEYPDLFVMDVEPPWSQMESVFFQQESSRLKKILTGIRLFLENRNPGRFAWAVRKLTQIVAKLRAENSSVFAAVFPFLIVDLVNGGSVLQDYLEMPVFPVPFDAYNVMFYNSYLPQTVPIFLPPDGAKRALFEYMNEMTKHFQQRAWVTLGSTWEGVIPGNEGKVFSSAHQLAPDIAAAKAAGVNTIWLYCLEGVLYSDQRLLERRPPKESESFFEVILTTSAFEPPINRKWSRKRAVMEWFTRDRLRKLYRWQSKY